MGRKSKPAPSSRSERKGKDNGKKFKKKVCIFCKEGVDFIDYKDVNLLRRFMSDRAKIRARRVTGNDSQQQREVAKAIKNAREMALLPYTSRVSASRSRTPPCSPRRRRRMRRRWRSTASTGPRAPTCGRRCRAGRCRSPC